MNAEIYTKSNCGYCVKAKQLLTTKNIAYVENIISPGFGETELLEHQRYVSKEQLLDKAPQARTVPQIWLNGHYIGGYTELKEFFDKTS